MSWFETELQKINDPEVIVFPAPRAEDVELFEAELGWKLGPDFRTVVSLAGGIGSSPDCVLGLTLGEVVVDFFEISDDEEGLQERLMNFVADLRRVLRNSRSNGLPLEYCPIAEDGMGGTYVVDCEDQVKVFYPTSEAPQFETAAGYSTVREVVAALLRTESQL